MQPPSLGPSSCCCCCSCYSVFHNLFRHCRTHLFPIDQTMCPSCFPCCDLTCVPNSPYHFRISTICSMGTFRLEHENFQYLS
ncbi:hypothetical protein Hanom_Chr12g01158301 [Helianthus anomalus]